MNGLMRVKKQADQVDMLNVAWDKLEAAGCLAPPAGPPLWLGLGSSAFVDRVAARQAMMPGVAIDWCSDVWSQTKRSDESTTEEKVKTLREKIAAQEDLKDLLAKQRESFLGLFQIQG